MFQQFQPHQNEVEGNQLSFVCAKRVFLGYCHFPEDRHVDEVGYMKLRDGNDENDHDLMRKLFEVVERSAVSIREILTFH